MSTGYRQQRPARQSSASVRRGARPSDQSAVQQIAVIDLAETELAGSYELPGAEMTPDEQAVEILAEQADEFTCGSCFLVRHRSQLAKERNGLKYCTDCEG